MRVEVREVWIRRADGDPLIATYNPGTHLITFCEVPMTLYDASRVIETVSDWTKRKCGRCGAIHDEI